MTKAQEDAAYYAVITAPVRYDPELSSTAKLLYCEITSLCNKKGYCWATNSYFAELYGLSVSTISRLIAKLERRGHIRVETVAVSNGSERRIYTDTYHVEPAEPEAPEGGTQKEQAPPGGCAKSARGDEQKAQGGVSKKRKQNDYQLNDYSDNNTPYSPPAGDAPTPAPEPQDKPAPKSKCSSKGSRRDKSTPDHDPEAFETFWAKYPRKDDRKAAIRAWDKLKPDKHLCRIMYNALTRQRASEQWAEEGGKYIPLFSTWLNGRKWENQGVDLSLLTGSRDSGGYWSDAPGVDP